ncbi:CG11378 [Drosophila busckii]|uniref:CG11378 n=1 Tax=Drosophila busckii TaxID=30019 RepID=A0A0M4F8Z9_DROBS|nr:27 kDa glycoprotein [Drosophila busckii]ALC48595.1 CG11378 [Drosophila busckii]
MNSYALLGVCLLASLGAFWLEVAQANPSPNMKMDTSQLESMTAKFLPPEFRNTNVSMAEIQRVYREKCKKATGVDNSTLYVEIEKAASKLSACLSGVANLTALQLEMEKARPIGELDTVFHKYCTRVPQAEACVKAFNEKVRPCLTTEELQHQATMMRIANSLLGFACARGGDQIALFVAEQGPECLDANKEAINNCLNRSFHQYLPKDGQMPDLMNRPEIFFSPTHCVDLQAFEACTLHHLEQCRDITPANIVQSVFRFVKNETECQAWMDAKANEQPVLLLAGNSTRGGAGALVSSLLGTLGLSLTALLLHN